MSAFLGVTLGWGVLLKRVGVRSWGGGGKEDKNGGTWGRGVRLSEKVWGGGGGRGLDNDEEQTRELHKRQHNSCSGQENPQGRGRKTCMRIRTGSARQLWQIKRCTLEKGPMGEQVRRGAMTEG